MAEMKGGYGIVYKTVMQDNTLSIESKGIYAYLCTFANSERECWPSVDAIRRDLKLSKDRFYKHMGQLLESGYVHKFSQRNRNRNAPNRYRLNQSHFQDSQIYQHPEKQESEKSERPNFDQPDFPYPENQYPENKDTNSTRENNTNKKQYHKETYSCSHITNEVFKLFNQAKSDARCKGRLKESSGEHYIEQLLRKGMTPDEIKLEAIAYTKAVKAEDIQWYWFTGFVNRDGKWRHRR